MKKLIVVSGFVLVVVVSGAVWLYATPSPIPTPQRSSVEPKITWSQPKLETILSPGETSYIDVTFTSNLPLNNIVIEAVPALAPYVTIQPSSFASVPAATAKSVRFSFGIASTTELGDYEGTIHVTIGNKTLPQTLEILVHVWQLFKDASSGITFAVPGLPVPVMIGNSGGTSDTLFVINAYVVNILNNTSRTLFSLLAFDNSSGDSLPVWFHKNIDPGGRLIAPGTFEQQTLPNGRPAFVLVSPLPVTYQGGLVAQAYMLSSSGNYVLAIIGSQTAQLTEFGFYSNEIPGILTSILGSVK